MPHLTGVNALPPPTPNTGPRIPFWSSDWFRGLLLAGAVILAYQPVWRAGFIWDDDVYVTQNQLLAASDGLRRIWLTQDSPSQYFPLTYTTFRLEYGLWQLNPAGYHWVNLLLHALNGLLAWRLLRRLEVPGAFLAAAFFALHPVQVESVAWVTERKNVLSLMFFLLALLAWVEFVEQQARRRWGYYGLAFLCGWLALFSKTTACTLPPAMLLVLWLRHKPISWSRIVQVGPFVASGLCMGLVTMWWERHHIGTSETMFSISPLERLLIACRGVWFYAWKLIWPVDLTFSYPRWMPEVTDPRAYLWPVLLLLLCVGLWHLRRRVGRGPEVAVAFFVVTLSPTLGFIMLFTFRYTFVADHYQYVACLGPLALAAAALTLRLPSAARPDLVGAALAVLLGVLTFHQAGAYRDLETLWRDTVRKNPASWMAHSNLGRLLMRQGRFDEAMEQCQYSLNLNPRDVDSLVSVGNALFGRQRYTEALEYYSRALAVNPDNPEAQANVGVILASQGRLDEAIEHNRRAVALSPLLLNARVNLGVLLARKGLYAEAMDHYRQALAIKPDQPMTHINLAIALRALGKDLEAETHFQLAATAANRHAASLAQQERFTEAALQYREAIRLIPRNAEAHYGLGLLLARQGRPAEARAEFQEALRIRPDYQPAEAQLRALGSGEAQQR